ncbi:MAG: hypothetical protein ACHP8A_09315 [Terriglobales bacterium]
MACASLGWLAFLPTPSSLTSFLLHQHNHKSVAQRDSPNFPDAAKPIMKQSQSGRVLSIAMLLLGLGGASYNAFERIYAPGASALKYEVLFVMWLVLGIGWGSRLLPNGPGESRKTNKTNRASASKTER